MSIITRKEFKIYNEIRAKLLTHDQSTQTDPEKEKSNETSIILMPINFGLYNNYEKYDGEEEDEEEDEEDEEENGEEEDEEEENEEEENEEEENEEEENEEEGGDEEEDEDKCKHLRKRKININNEISKENYEDDKDKNSDIETIEFKKKSNKQKNTVSYIREERQYYKELPKKKQKIIDNFEKQIQDINFVKTPMRFKILESNMDIKLKALTVNKVDQLNSIDPSSSEYMKLYNWIENISKLPIGKYKQLPINYNNSSDDITSFLDVTRKTLDTKVFGHIDAKNQIIRLLAKWISNPDSKGLVIGIEGPMGCGKCHGIDTPILMYDGSIKMVQDIEIGDIVMGDDSKPRNVLALGRGEDELYDVIPIKGEKYTVNSEHILCLKQSGEGSIEILSNKDNITSYKTVRFNNKTQKINSKNFNYIGDVKKYLKSFSENENIIEISIKDYLKLPIYIKNNWLRGYKTGVDFPTKEVLFDPYIIGYWLGNGLSDSTFGLELCDSFTYSKISIQNSKILNYLYTELKKYNLNLNFIYNLNNLNKYDYEISSDERPNLFFQYLQYYNLINNKHIPDEYKINDKNTRLSVLAGLIDSDGYFNENYFEIIQKSKIFSDDILYISRSLGFDAYQKSCNKSCIHKCKKITGLYYRIIISGNDLDKIPVKCLKNKAPKKMQVKDALMTEIKVKSKGYGKYYGFTLDGNNRYLLGDFTVTHNTTLCNGICESLNLPFGFVQLGGISDGSYLVGHSYTYEGSRHGRISEILMKVGCMNPVLYFDELDKISSTRHGEEIVNILIHLTDASQNDKFHDKYFSDIEFDMSKCLIVFSYNNSELINPILKDRMISIKTEGYNHKDKLKIAKEYMLPLILKEFSLNIEDVIIHDEVFNYIINMTEEEKGVRNLKRSLEELVSQINLHKLLKQNIIDKEELKFPITITQDIIDKFIRKKELNTSLSMMYI
jgi:ATP-dependent Lon protease